MISSAITYLNQSVPVRVSDEDKGSEYKINEVVDGEKIFILAS